MKTHECTWLQKQGKRVSSLQPIKQNQANPNDNDVASSTSIPTPLSVKPLKETIALSEKQAIQNALALTKGNKLEAAKLLEIGRTSFYEKCKLYDIK
ncbi:helix-turn-helix domain-containing protein [Bacillus sp. ISL-7]|uniref:helix-turn-helix domain-containing protein n=1 Tax=Bacillus sp. ISL-7 TaxID=2819136 RepID=UPI001BEB3F74|nr:helix-turn-helix domain-containing protein [Bacillus sp. ISL-7]MBT2734042.1 hypothetical protein [Bacillus sp. ISL-7]